MALDIVNHDPSPGKMAERGHRNIFKKSKESLITKASTRGWIIASRHGPVGRYRTVLVISAAHHLVVEEL